MQNKGTTKIQNNQQQQQQQVQVQQYDSFLYKFQQQIIDAWKPVPHTSSVICLTLGIVLILTSVKTQQITVRYDNLSTCALGTTGCSTTFTISQTLQAPVFLYYGMTNFYQNHRRYIKFFSSKQLNNGAQEQEDALSSCGTYVRNGKLGYTTSATGATLNANDIGFPCGTSGRIYNMFRPQLISFGIKYPNSSVISISKQGIAWKSDIGRHKNWDLTKQPFSVTEQDWLVWYRPAARQNFNKLFGIVNVNLQPGTYTFNFDNKFDASFGEKTLHIAKSNYIGNRDLFLGIAFLVLGGCCVILLIVFIAKWIAQIRDKPHIS